VASAERAKKKPARPAREAAVAPVRRERDRRALSHVGGKVELEGGSPEDQSALSDALTVRADEDSTQAHVHGFHSYPARLHPLTARGLVEGFSRPEATVLDPFCGAGTTLLLAGRMTRPGVLLGADVRPDALAAARTNVGSLETPLLLVRADATRQPWADASADRVVANLPFGKRVGSHDANRSLYPAFLRELDRALAGDGRAVLLTEDKRLLVDSVQRTRGLRIVKETTFGSGGAHPTAYVVVRSRGQARRRANRPT